jgi:hypothetical protein
LKISYNRFPYTPAVEDGAFDTISLSHSSIETTQAAIIFCPLATLGQTVSALGWQEAVTLGNRRSLYTTVVATLAALHIVLSLGPPLVGFRRLSIVMEPLEGIVAGPYLGFLAGTVGWIGGRFVRPDAFWIENFFGIAEAVGALGAGFLITRRWYFTAGIYGGQLLAFLLHPLARYIPLWTLWDTYLGFIAIVGVPVLIAVEKSKILKWPLS